MTKQEAVMHYKAAIAIFRKWLETGIITADDFRIISTNTAEKYSINSTSIFFENGETPVDLLSIQSDK
ncbi:MAG: hypothetical protein LBQ48_02840 [Oscillospiraceae bacterium]|jgi:protein associated with RNAse G/E|nr:hypothetical protein [Oscillospiraceae bacterium]